MAFPTLHMQCIKLGKSVTFLLRVIYNYKTVTLLHVTEISNVMLTYIYDMYNTDYSMHIFVYISWSEFPRWIMH